MQRSHALSATTSRTLRAVCCIGHSLDSIHGYAWKVAGVNILKIIEAIQVECDLQENCQNEKLLGLNVSKHNGDKQWPVFL